MSGENKFAEKPKSNRCEEIEEAAEDGAGETSDDSSKIANKENTDDAALSGKDCESDVKETDSAESDRQPDGDDREGLQISEQTEDVAGEESSDAADEPDGNEDESSEEKSDREESPESPEKLIADLESELEAVKSERDKSLEEVARLKERLLRAAADMDNLRKRTKREIRDGKIKGREIVCSEMLGVVDNLERALEHASAKGTVESMVEGVELVLRQFFAAIEKFGVKPFSAKGEPFDPVFHEAIGQVESSEVAPNVVVEEWQKGYTIDDRLLRPAVVVVSKPPAEDEGGPDKDETREENAKVEKQGGEDSGEGPVSTKAEAGEDAEAEAGEDAEAGVGDESPDPVDEGSEAGKPENEKSES